MSSHRRLTSALVLVAVTIAATASPLSAIELDEPPPYHRRHFELLDLPFDRLPWTGAPPPSLPAQPPRDDAGIRLFRWRDGKLYYRPGSVAINGMKRLDAYRDTGDRRQLEQALVHARHLERMRIVRHDAWWLPFWFDYPPEGLKAPWFNAMSQGLALSFFVRLHRITGDPAHLEVAEQIFESFMRLGRKSVRGRYWVAYVADGGYLWLEHYPNGQPDHVLNAHLHAMVGLYEYWQATRSAAARQLLEGALTTMRDRAGSYRRPGRVSIYGKRSRTNHHRYHEVHIWQLRFLGRITGDAWFTALGDALAEDARPARSVPGRPASSRLVTQLSSAPKVWRVAPYPPTSPMLERAA